MEHTPHALDYLSVVRRRRWWLLVPIVASIAIGIALAQWLPRQYSASATLAVAAPAVSPSLVNQGAVLDTQDRVRALTQQLLSDSVLTRVVQEEGASGDAAERAIDGIRSSVKVSLPEPVSRGVDDRRLDTFVISYTDDDPARAQRITNRLADVFVEETSKTRTTVAETTSTFLRNERDRSYARLTELEGQLRQAKEAHMGRLPEQTSANLQTLAGLRQQVDINANSLRHEQDRLAMLQRQIEMLEEEATQGVAPSSAPGAPDRVGEIERELVTARAMYTDKHPEVQRLEAALQTAIAESRKPTTIPVEDRKARLQLNPTYRQLAAERDSTRLAIRDLELTLGTLRSQISDYQRRVEVAPMVEQQLASVQREYDLAQRQYADLSNRFESAVMAENVARNRDGEQFTVFSHAGLPTTPVSPNPMRVMVMAILAGLVLGAGAALGREYLDRSVYSAGDLTDDLDVPVLGEVAHIRA